MAEQQIDLKKEQAKLVGLQVKYDLLIKTPLSSVKDCCELINDRNKALAAKNVQAQRIRDIQSGKIVSAKPIGNRKLKKEN